MSAHIIIPKGVLAGSTRVTEVEFALRTMVDYDMTYLRDRIVTQLFVNGKPAGPYSAMAVPEDLSASRFGPAEIIHRYGKETERNVIDTFLGTGWRQETATLGREIRTLRERIAHLERVRWWQLRRRLAAARVDRAARRLRDAVEA